MAIKLNAGFYRPIGESVPKNEMWDDFLGSIVDDFKYLRQNGLIEQDTPHYICSTMIGQALSSSVICWDDLTSRLKAIDFSAPLITTYECASWGYLLEYVRKIQDGDGKVLITIVDLNIMGLDGWSVHPGWGKSGFGYTLLCLDLQDLQDDELVTGLAQPESTLPSFCRFLMQRGSKNYPAIVSVPFNAEQTQSTLLSALKGRTVLPNLYERWGHCFGSDSWIGLITHIESLAECSEEALIFDVGSFAYGGFFCSALIEVELSEQSSLANFRVWDESPTNSNKNLTASNA